MKRIKLIVAYDGTNYHGWQMQKNAITVEEILNRILSKVLKEKIEVMGASRTDSGVHALGNVAVFDSETYIPPDKLSYVINQSLPNDIIIQSSCQVADDFHPRFCKSLKTYEYKILNRKFDVPTLNRYAYFVYLPLDVEKMQEAANYLIGEHDFESFCSMNPQVKTTVRTIYSIDIKREEDLITIRIQGNGFLYNMVRIITGTLVLVGRGKRDPIKLKEILSLKNRVVAGPKAPPNGLTLIKIDYL